MAGYKGWGFGLMAEFLAAGLTGSMLSQNVKPLKTPEGPPHDLGQFYLLIDPASGPSFFDSVTQVADAVARDEGTRMPGQGRKPAETVDVPEPLWRLTMALAGQTQT